MSFAPPDTSRLDILVYETKNSLHDIYVFNLNQFLKSRQKKTKEEERFKLINFAPFNQVHKVMNIIWGNGHSAKLVQRRQKLVENLCRIYVERILKKFG